MLLKATTMTTMGEETLTMMEGLNFEEAKVKQYLAIRCSSISQRIWESFCEGLHPFEGKYFGNFPLLL